MMLKTLSMREKLPGGGDFEFAFGVKMTGLTYINVLFEEKMLGAYVSVTEETFFPILETSKFFTFIICCRLVF